MGKSRANTNSAWREGFLFVGNQLVLDFLNTRPVQEGSARELLSDFGALLRWFQAADLLSARDAAGLQRKWAGSTRARRTLEAMWTLRERLRKSVLAWEDGGDVPPSIVAELNRWMVDHPMLSRLRARGSTLATELWFGPRQPEDLFAPLARAAAGLFAEVDRKRVRKCGECVLHFLDSSKKGNRRWCSMQLCGNRLKVAAYADRQRVSGLV